MDTQRPNDVFKLFALRDKWQVLVERLGTSRIERQREGNLMTETVKGHGLKWNGTACICGGWSCLDIGRPHSEVESQESYAQHLASLPPQTHEPPAPDEGIYVDFHNLQIEHDKLFDMVSRLREFLMNNRVAMTYQTLGQYRAAALGVLKEKADGSKH
jgi:hypothetical protein